MPERELEVATATQMTRSDISREGARRGRTLLLAGVMVPKVL